MKFRTSLIKLTTDRLTHYSVWPHETRCGIHLQNKQVQHVHVNTNIILCPRCKKSTAPPLRKPFTKNFNTNNPRQTLEEMILFYNMLNKDDRALLGLLEVLEFDKGDLALFLECKEREILDTISKSHIHISYELDGLLQFAKISIHKIQLFKSTIITQLLNSWEPRYN